MGKHERQQIEEAEKIIVKLLNSQKINDLDRKNRHCLQPEFKQFR